MKKVFQFVGICLLAGFLHSCVDNEGFDPGPQFDFAYVDVLDPDSSGWVGGFADYPDSLADKLNFKVEYTELEGAFPQDNEVLRVSAKNPHKDLFYYVAKKFDGLKANTQYSIATAFELQSAILTDTAGSFSFELFFKMGASSVRPDTILDINSSSSKYKLNLNKGENETVGSDFVFLGKPDPNLKISKSSPKVIKNGDLTVTKTVETNSDGELWIVVGIDSKMPFEMAFSYNTIVVYFKEL